MTIREENRLNGQVAQFLVGQIIMADKLQKQLQNSNDKYSKMEKNVGDLYKVVEDLETTVDDLAQCLRHDCVEPILHKPSSRSML